MHLEREESPRRCLGPLPAGCPVRVTSVYTQKKPGSEEPGFRVWAGDGTRTRDISLNELHSATSYSRM